MENKNKFEFEEPVYLYSRTLKTFLSRLDSTLLDMEEEIQHQKDNAEKWRKDYMQIMNEQLRDGQRMIANTLIACLSPTVDVLNPASAVILAHIRDNCHTIEDVKAYINDMIERSKDENGELKLTNIKEIKISE